jgi:predicted transcriptional regulator
MRSEDVGAVPIVSDHMDRRLIGIVTDRDIAIKAVADGRDPNTTRIESVMSRALVTGYPEDDLEVAMNRMSRNQVRRLPIVDRNNCLIGIVSQADLARNLDREEVGGVVEEISDSGRFSFPNPFQSRSRHSAQRASTNWPDESYGEQSYGAGSSALIGAACLAAGAALMYLLDPARGGYRRALVRDKAVRLYNSAGDVLGATARDVSNRATGLAAETRSKFESEEPVSDEKLAQRVKSRIGHEISHPHAIDVIVRDACVIVQGPIVSNEVDVLLSCIRSIPGVRNVESRLEVHAQGGSHPNPQGGREFASR